MPDYPIPPDEVTDATGATERTFTFVVHQFDEWWVHMRKSTPGFADALEMRQELLALESVHTVLIVPWLAGYEIEKALEFGRYDGTYVNGRSFDHFLWQDGQVVIGEHTL